MMLNVLTLSTLFPDLSRPNFGVFVERQTRELASRPDVAVTVIAPVGLPPGPFAGMARYRALSHLPAVERWRDLTVHRPRFPIIPGVSGRLNVFTMTRAILPLVRRLHTEQPFDVIDASFFYPDGPVGARIARALGIPLSIKARGADIHYWGRRPATRGAVRKAAELATGLLAVSDAMRRTMIGLGMDGEKITVHYTGVDLERFQPMDSAQAKAGFGLSGPVVLCVGALIPRKGQELLVRAVSTMPDVTLILAGQGPDKHALSDLASRLGMADRLGLLGAVPHDQLPPLYAAADVMALPSSSEGLANAWVEALACGTPVVTCDVGGARELLDRAEAGHIVEREAEAIAVAIRDLIESPPEREAVRETALRFTWSANGDALEAHLRRLAGKA
jgi:glycosyltransferase involved in cell wall biosynthesis